VATTDLTITLDPVFTRMLQVQRDIQAQYMGGDPADMDDETRISFLRNMSLSLILEVGEALEETQWKPWARVKPDLPIVDHKKFVGEMADVYIFFMNMMLAGGVSTLDLAKAVTAKQEVNIQRQLDGYNGKDTKCPGCKRAYDDPSVKCYRAEPGAVAAGWCASIWPDGEWVTSEGRVIQ
jgi:hypothetical protein